VRRIAAQPKDDAGLRRRLAPARSPRRQGVRTARRVSLRLDQPWRSFMIDIAWHAHRHVAIHRASRHSTGRRETAWAMHVFGDVLIFVAACSVTYGLGTRHRPYFECVNEANDAERCGKSIFGDCPALLGVMPGRVCPVTLFVVREDSTILPSFGSARDRCVGRRARRPRVRAPGQFCSSYIVIRVVLRTVCLSLIHH
jgi:hypothetical protein